MYVLATPREILYIYICLYRYVLFHAISTSIHGGDESNIIQSLHKTSNKNGGLISQGNPGQGLISQRPGHSKELTFLKTRHGL